MVRSLMAAWSHSATIRVCVHAVVLTAALAAGFVMFRASAGQAEGIDLARRAEVTTDLDLKIKRFVAQPLSQSCLPFWFTNHWSNEARVAIGAAALGLLVPLGMALGLDGSTVSRALRTAGLLVLKRADGSPVAGRLEPIANFDGDKVVGRASCRPPRCATRRPTRWWSKAAPPA